MNRCDAIIVGAGPAGLSAARTLKRAGVSAVVVLDREVEAGGIPRHCAHRGFGTGQFRWPYTGPGYVRRLLRELDGVAIQTPAAVVQIRPGGELSIATPEGLKSLAARTVLLATGTRELPRPPRLVGGVRPFGLLTTGALQQFVNLGRQIPFYRPVIVGSEWVAFSALLTLRGAGAQPVAMVEENDRIAARRPADLIARWCWRVPVLTGTRVSRVLGDERVSAVEIEDSTGRRRLECDGVLFTGRFVPESTLVRHSHLELDRGSGGPVIDQHWRCSDPIYFAAGNVLRPVETAGVSAEEGEAAARSMLRALSGRLPAPERRIRVRAGEALRYVYPQVIALPDDCSHGTVLRARATRAVRGTLRLIRNGEELSRRRVSVLPERRIHVRAERLAAEDLETLELSLEDRNSTRESISARHTTRQSKAPDGQQSQAAGGRTRGAPFRCAAPRPSVR